MYKIFIILFTYYIIFYTNNVFAFNCENKLNNICCDISCIKCDFCSNNVTLNNLCCNETIFKNGIFCDDKNLPPCILNENTMIDSNMTKNDFDMFLQWIVTLQLWQLIIFVSGALILLIFIFYSCCCIGTKKPPLKYADIKNKVL